MQVKIVREMSESEQQIADLEWEADTNRILFAKARAEGRDDAAARYDRAVRSLLDELTGLYGHEELARGV